MLPPSHPQGSWRKWDPVPQEAVSQLAHPQCSLTHHCLLHLENDSEWPKSIDTRPREVTQHLQWADCRSFSAFSAGVAPWPALPPLTRTLPRKEPVFPAVDFSSTAMCVMCLVTKSCVTLCDPMHNSSPGSSVHGDSRGKNTGVGCSALLQGIFSTQ